MILVAGATGELGRVICRKLTERGGMVYGMVRAGSSPAAVAELEAMGVVPVQADLGNRESLRDACSGCDSVVSGVTAMGRAGESIERVDTRVLQIVYRFERGTLPVYVGQLMDVFIEASPIGGAMATSAARAED